MGRYLDWNYCCYRCEILDMPFSLFLFFFRLLFFPLVGILVICIGLLCRIECGWDIGCIR